MIYKSAIQQFLSYLEKQRGFSEHTLKAYDSDLHQLLNYLQLPDTVSLHMVLQKERLRGFIYSLSSQGNKPRTIARKRASILSFSKWALKEDHIHSNPMRNIGAPKLDTPLPAVLSKVEAQEIIQYQPKNNKEIRNRAIVEFLYGSGIRLAELHQLNRESINTSKKNG